MSKPQSSKRKAEEGSLESTDVKKLATYVNSLYWKDGLKRAMEDPNLVVKSEEYTVTIRDKFPKARYHFLIIPKIDITDIECLNRSHIQLLQHMERQAFSIIESHSSEILSSYFNIGYHAIPSMRPFHLHVISQDFDSPCLKTKKHWNSFTTDFFRNSADVLKELENNGKIQINKTLFESLLKSTLRCHWCNETQKNMPTLKIHINNCSRNKLTFP